MHGETVWGFSKGMAQPKPKTLKPFSLPNYKVPFSMRSSMQVWFGFITTSLYKFYYLCGDPMVILITIVTIMPTPRGG